MSKRRASEALVASPMPPPTRLVVATINVWNSKGVPGGPWPARIPALQKVVNLCNADLLGVQEAQPEILAVIDEALPSHTRLVVNADSPEHACWTTEGTIYYRKDLLQLLGQGTDCAASFPEKPHRRLFWGRFGVLGGDGTTLLFTTCHMPWQGQDVDGKSARFECSHSVAEALGRLARPGEPAFCVGDFNESFGPPRVLRKSGFVDCFSALCLPVTPTHPARPSVAKEEELPDRALDWICANACARPLLANVLRPSPGLLSEACVHATDHFPVVAVYELGSG